MRFGRTGVNIGEEIVVHAGAVAIGIDVHAFAAAVDLRAAR